MLLIPYLVEATLGTYKQPNAEFLDVVITSSSFSSFKVR